MSSPWIGLRTGLLAILLVSLAMVAFIVWQFYESAGFFTALLYGLGFGGSIWAVAALSYGFNRMVRGRRDS